MKMKYFEKDKLDDEKIIADLRQAAIDYENGEIIEVRDNLLDIIQAINEFDDMY